MNITNDTTHKKRYASPLMETLAVRTENIMDITASAPGFKWGAKGYGGGFDEDDEDADAEE